MDKKDIQSIVAFKAATTYTGVSVSELFGYRDPPFVIRYPNKLYPNYLILGVSLSELVRIPRPPRGLGIRTQKNNNSLSEQILSELFDIRGLGIRTGSRYPNRGQKVVKNRKLMQC